jgi:hypothetical protein
MVNLYPETHEVLSKIREDLNLELSKEDWKELENILFNFYDETYRQGMTDCLYMADDLVTSGLFLQFAE